MREDNYISKANKLLLPIYIVCTIFIAIAVMVNNIIRGAILGVALVIIDLFILYVVKKSNKVYLSAYIIPFAALLGGFGYALSSGGGSYLLFEFSMVSMFCMLYANRKAYIVLAIIEDVLFAFTQFILGVSLLGDQLNASVLAMHCFILILVQVLGERIITWIRASETIIMESEQNAVKTIEIVKDTGEELAVEVKYLKESTNETSKKSQKVLEAIDSIQNGANQQVATMVTMNQSINGVAEKVQDTVIFCERLSQKGKGLSAATKANLSEVQNVEKNIEDIQANMNKAKSTVDEFAENMREVMNVLSGIKEISNQINLLSLNASIEAARSGEAGRGFAVVAEQIRILSEQTKDTTNQIELVVKKAQDKVGDITEVVDSGDVIALEGQKSISTLYEKYNQMITDFVDMEENIQKEYSQIEEVFALVKEVEDNVENVTAISEEYVTASEHVLDLQRGQQEEIKKVEEVYLRINEQSNTLLEVANS